MGKLNNIQNKINAKMKGVLADVSFPYSCESRSDAPFDPENPRPSTSTYNWQGIFGLSFTVKDTENFKIEAQDQKGIVFMRNNDAMIPQEPKIDDVMTVRGIRFIVIDLVKIPADNGWVLQLRRYG